MQKTSKTHQRDLEFKWDQDIHMQFVLIAMAFGIRNVTPKQIQLVLQADVSREQIASHLQKFRMKIVKQYGVINYLQLTNKHFPLDLVNPKLN